MSPQLIFGTAAFGMSGTAFHDQSTVNAVLQLCKEGGVSRLDTAARYPPNNSGQSERLIGDTSEISHTFVIDTKVMTGPHPDGAGDLSVQSMDESVAQSLARLKINQVNVLYAHRPDPSTPVEEQVRAFNKQLDEGRAKEYGLSNHSVEQVKAYLDACERLGLKKPTVYQGDYNILTRGVESELLPLLRQHGMRFNGYRPIAAGILSGKFVNGETEGTRFAGDGAIAVGMRKLFDSQVLHNAVRDFLRAIAAHGLSGIEVGLRWLYHHSPLSEEDGIIFGASRNSQLEENLGILARGPLPAQVVQIVDDIWDKLRDGTVSTV